MNINVNSESPRRWHGSERELSLDLQCDFKFNVLPISTYSSLGVFDVHCVY